MAGITKVVQCHRPLLFTSYAFGRFRCGSGGDFKFYTLKEEFDCLECLFSTLHTYGKAWKDFSPLSKPKKGVSRRNNNSFGVQEVAVTSSGEYLQRGVHQDLHVVHKVQQKVRPNRLGLSQEKIKKEFPSISLHLKKKILSGFNWNSPRIKVQKQYIPPPPLHP